MRAREALDACRDLCRALDEADLSRLVRPIAGPAVVTLGLGLGACSDRAPEPEPTPTVYAAPPVEVCNDRQDNDGNGSIDCADPGCTEDPACALRPPVPPYGIPFPPPDAVDAAVPQPTDPTPPVPPPASTAYGVPFPPDAGPTP